MKEERAEWPLFWCLPIETQARLMQWYWDEFGHNLPIPAAPGQTPAEWKVTLEESHEDIDLLMREKPRPKGTAAHG